MAESELSGTASVHAWQSDRGFILKITLGSHLPPQE